MILAPDYSEILIKASDSYTYFGIARFFWRRTFADPSRGIVVRAVARAVPAAEFTDIALRRSDRNATKVCACARSNEDGAVQLAVQHRAKAAVVRRRIAQLGRIVGFGASDFRRCAVTNEERQTADQHPDLAAFRHFRDVDFSARGCAGVPGRRQLLDEWPRDRGHAASRDGRRRDMNEIPPVFRRREQSLPLRLSIRVPTHEFPMPSGAFVALSPPQGLPPTWRGVARKPLK